MKIPFNCTKCGKAITEGELCLTVLVNLEKHGDPVKVLISHVNIALCNDCGKRDFGKLRDSVDGLHDYIVNNLNHES